MLAIHCTAYESRCSWVSKDLIDWSGAISCVCWFVGFAILIDWIVFDTFSAWGPSRRALIGATLKLIASAFFCVEPFSDMAGYLDAVPAPMGNSSSSNTSSSSGATTTDYPLPSGVPWSNFVGILFFHIGNVIDFLGMLPLFDCSRPCSGANLPVLGMTTYMSATWLLAIAGGFAYFATPFPWGPGDTTPTEFVAPAQILGAALLLVGSLLYTGWAACFGRPLPRTDSLLDVVAPIVG